MQTLAEALGTATLFTFPFWLAAFAEVGTPLDAPYLSNMYHSALVFVHVDYISAIIIIFGLALLLWAVIYRTRFNSPASGRLAGFLSLLGLFSFLNGLRIYFFAWLNFDWAVGFFWLSLPVVLVLLYSAWRWRKPILGAVMPLARTGAAIFLLILINVIVAVIKLEPASLIAYTAPGTGEPDIASTAANRVVWIIFDELDERVGFVDRPDTVQMPALDRFRSESIVATRAEPPGDSTLYSMPTLLLGRLVGSARHTKQDDLLLHFRDGRTALWTESPGILQKAKSGRMDVALLAQSGHAYCRLFAKYLAHCMENGQHWRATNRTVITGFRTVLSTVAQHFPFVQRLSRGTVFLPRLNPKVEEHEAFKDSVNAVLANPAFELIILHWNIPHRPFFYDHLKNDFIDPDLRGPDSVIGYLGNLELTDRAFASMRATLEAARLWNSSTVIVSADHRWRHADKLDGKTSVTVPLMIKLPSMDKGRTTAKEVKAVNSADLVWGLLTGTIKNTEDTVRALLP